MSEWPPPTPLEPAEFYRLHAEEVRAQVRLNHERALGFLGFNLAFLWLATWSGGVVLHVAAGLSALACAAAVHLGHRYYRNARGRRREVEAKLGIELGFATTAGQRGEPHWLTVTRLVVGLHVMIAVVAVVATLHE
jgi:hypothetical protein